MEAVRPSLVYSLGLPPTSAGFCLLHLPKGWRLTGYFYSVTLWILPACSLGRFFGGKAGFNE